MEKCHFISTKTKEPCSDTDILPFGFCKKHSKTVQGQAAKDAWNRSKQESNTTEKAKFLEKEKLISEEKLLEKEKHIEKLLEKEKNLEKLLEKKQNLEKKDKGKEKEEYPKGKKKKDVRKIVISKNSLGRFEEPTTHIVFDPHSSKAYGVQGKNGELLPLKPGHIEICDSHGWKILHTDSYLSD